MSLDYSDDEAANTTGYKEINRKMDNLARTVASLVKTVAEQAKPKAANYAQALRGNDSAQMANGKAGHKRGPSTTARQAPQPKEARKTAQRKPTRVVLRVSKVAEDHSIRHQTEMQLLQLLEQPLYRSTGVKIQTVRRLESGDIALNLLTEDDVQKVFRADQAWLAAGIGHLGPPPILNIPGHTISRSIVLHGVPCDKTVADTCRAVESRTSSNVESGSWLIGEARRQGRKASSMRITFREADACNRILERGQIGIDNQVFYVGEYRHMPRLEQCNRCQAFDHQTHWCEAPLPSCRVCAGPHQTKDHPDCTRCPPRRQGPLEEGEEAPAPCPHKQYKCANCGGAHAASNRDCPHRQQQIPRWN